jgi:DNA-binding phage protein
MAKNTELKTTVSPSLHPANITGIAGYEEHKAYLQHSVTAVDSAYQAVEHVMEARKKLALDESRTPKARVLMAAQMADKYMDQLQRMFESSWNQLTKGIDHSELQLSKPLEEYAGIGNVASEIRAHLKSMTAGERVKFLGEALERGDEKTLKSVLGAPSYLSGMSELEQQHITRNYHSKNNPQMAQRVELMKQVRDKLERVRPVLLQEMERAVGANKLEIAKLKAVSSEAEAALILKEFTPVQD